MAQPARAEQRRQLESTTALIRQIDDLRRDLLTLLNSLQESDTAPTAPAIEAARQLRERLRKLPE
ncbi:MAG: hypothetical protein ACK496_13640 [Acidobacteriota bacterium]